MKKIRFKVAALLLAGVTILTALPACQPAIPADSYVAVVPTVLNSGTTQAVALTLFSGDQLVRGSVEVSLLKDGKKVAAASETIDGNGTISLNVPRLDDGKYEIQVKGNGFQDKTAVSVENGFLVFVETDKPIYKPGQTMHLRVLTLDPELKPVDESVTVEVLDAKGIKIFRRIVQTDDFGMAGLDLPISEEPNLGVWKINVITAKAKNQLDVRVEEYVLPKYEVKVDLPKEWFLVSESIKGKISGEYTFGKPVKGNLKIEALKYVGQWQTYATFSKPIDGSIDFEIPPAGYVAGVPQAGGQGNVQLNITVEEKSTGYVEKTSRLLTVAQSPVVLQLIPSGSIFKPGLPFNVMVVTQTPDNQLVDGKVTVTATFANGKAEDIGTVKKELKTVKGKAVLELSPPDEAVAVTLEANSGDAYTSLALQSAYSPSGNFIHIEQTSEGTPQVGQKIAFKVYSTSQAVNFYYEILSRGKVVFSDYTRDREISFSTTPLMAPTSKLLVYQILPNSEVAADYLPFNVAASYPQKVTAEFSQEEAKPGDELQISIKTEGMAKVGIAAVDKSVFILAENRMNLQQVFDELERLYMEPQGELHEVSFYPTMTSVGAEDVFKDAGVAVMSNKKIPQSKEYKVERGGNWLSKILGFFGGRNGLVEDGMMPPMMAQGAKSSETSSTGGGLAEVQRVRQYFPETWLWSDFTTDGSGRAVKQVTVPDSITTWMLRAVAISKSKGLGIAEDELRVFQPFFLTIDLPYSAIRGEEFPVRVSVYNYLDKPQRVQVDIEPAGWFELLDSSSKTIELGASDIGGAQFMIRPTGIGITNEVKISARSPEMADAAIKTIIIEPEGVSREIVDNLALAGGIRKTIDTSIPPLEMFRDEKGGIIPVLPVVVPDSGRAYIAITSSFLAQTINGLDALLQMPFGCGEQNMIVFAPDVYITKYLRESGQLKPEIMAKAEKLMVTGYQRELTYRRSDGSFSAFGMSDNEGSLWLTAFVLKCFAEAKDVTYIDESVLNDAIKWITSHQKSDGSFEAVGFVHHQEMLGGLKGKDALTAFVAIALLEAGEKTSAGKAIDYLETRLADLDDPYALAITAYALEMAGSAKGDDACDRLLKMAREDENGLYWGSDTVEASSSAPKMGIARSMPEINRSAQIETTAYATLALVKHGDVLNASRSAKWLTSKRNAAGGFGSTQDTVVTLQALIVFSTSGRADVDLTVNLKGDGLNKQVKINKDNYDVLQIVPVPIDTQIEMTVAGKGDAIGQVVRRFNLEAVEQPAEEKILNIDVEYDTTDVAVNDLIEVSVNLEFNPPEPVDTGMIVLDVSVPTGFAPVIESVIAVTRQNANIKRYDIAGRKVIFYVEDMKPGDRIAFVFNVKALYPVKAKGVSSQAYSYYKPEIKGETLGAAVTVR
jgi:CD109 antigen